MSEGKKTHVYLGNGKTFTLFCTFHTQHQAYINAICKQAADAGWATLVLESDEDVAETLFVGIDYAAKSPT